MILERVENRNRERPLEVQQKQSDGAEQSRDCTFCRRAELLDLARTPRKLNADLNPDDENSRRLPSFMMRKVAFWKSRFGNKTCSTTSTSNKIAVIQLAE